MKLAPEGNIIVYPLSILLILSIISSYLYNISSIHIITSVLTVLMIFCLNFFRDPIRITPKQDNLILSPAVGGIIIGYEIGKLLKKETIFCERVSGKFVLRRGFNIKKNLRVLIVEDVITTGKSSLECVKLIKKSGAKLAGFACIIDRSNKNNLKIKKKIVSQIKLNIPTYKKQNLPSKLKNITITKPGSRYLK